MSRKYKFHDPEGVYFISFATVYWLDIFIRQVYFNILEESVIHCRQNKGMEIFAYCFMPSHLHFIFRSTNKDPSGLIRDFKGYTSRKLLKTIAENPQESRKEWLLWMFERAGKNKSNVMKYQFWQQHNKPIELWSPKVIQQKIDYIHNNPVISGFVTNPIDYKYSSAKNFAEEHSVLEIDDIGFLAS
ncbi:REP-associated tyrosine transposase [Spongiimicrobium salis]|uniref:REP-associated tyrosine transposase n=1 Tax=Spongiimicrobium salis TaxID=1667022 RepID=UPI00374D845A